MTFLLNLLSLLGCAAAVAVFVTVGLRMLIPKEPHSPAAGRPRLRKRLAGFALPTALLVVELLATAVVTAYGAPVGDRGGTVVEVIETGECRRPVTGFGFVQSCTPAGYRSTVPSDSYLERGESPTVIGGATVGSGDRVAKYTAVGWDRWLMPFADRSQWRSVSDEERPNLLWLPAAAMGGAALGFGALAKALRRQADRTAAVEHLT
ncbi:hypothetical protein K3N28_07645 [Glycomyces sp. TRM65418]|uniref:hypothetical protein n=1 Tax=Glycomyces sp. TRM65418 TaxID=2867006 RepID=UPI001CE6433F|nr:hypothetical protein [Glycomyces sp. TRM65418]MCC3762944.1 hypothetical protein [Glycomyces sp. TRM65418]QZD56968.1 hypothetical protein K3N28_07595 [Glycomyces sp. TRM65418]